MALFLLTLKEKYLLTQKAVDFAVGQAQHMLSFAKEDLKDSVLMGLQEHSLAAGSSMPDVSRYFEISVPFGNLSTEYMQTKCSTVKTST